MSVLLTTSWPFRRVHIQTQNFQEELYDLPKSNFRYSKIHIFRVQALNKASTVCGSQDYCPSDLEDADDILTQEQKQKLIQQEPDERVVLAFNNYALPDVEAFHYGIYHSISSERRIRSFALGGLYFLYIF